jgi:hypothetical protein
MGRWPCWQRREPCRAKRAYARIGAVSAGGACSGGRGSDVAAMLAALNAGTADTIPFANSRKTCYSMGRTTDRGNAQAARQYSRRRSAAYRLIMVRSFAERWRVRHAARGEKRVAGLVLGPDSSGGFLLVDQPQVLSQGWGVSQTLATLTPFFGNHAPEFWREFAVSVLRTGSSCGGRLGRRAPAGVDLRGRGGDGEDCGVDFACDGSQYVPKPVLGQSPGQSLRTRSLMTSRKEKGGVL